MTETSPLPLTLDLDRRIYSDAVLSKVTYRLSQNCAVERNLVDESCERWIVTPLLDEETSSPPDAATLRAQITRLLSDYKLRQIVDDETRDIRTVLYVKAFAGSDLFEEEEPPQNSKDNS